MSTKPAAQRYLIQIDLAEKPNARVDLSVLQRLLDRTGIELDAKYAPVCINPQQRRFVVRGEATLEARQRAEKKLGADVKFFSDSRVQPMAGGKRA
jgi:hypothetical protein